MPNAHSHVKKRPATHPPRFARVTEQTPNAASANTEANVAAPITQSLAAEPLPAPVASAQDGSPAGCGPEATRGRGKGWLSLLCGLGALVLAGAGEALVEAHNTTILSLFLYLAGIALFAWSALLIPRTISDYRAPELELRHVRPRNLRALAILVMGVLLAIVMNAVSFFSLRQDLKSGVGGWLWLASLLVLAGTGVALHRYFGWSARWNGGALPLSSRNRLLVIGVIVAILVVAAIARFAALDIVPFGINADEGDRAATAMQVIRGTDTDSIFADGWYQISLMYFTLLSWLLRVIGIGFVQARIFGGIASLIACAIIIWIGIRHFGLRVGLFAGGIFALLAIALQFARETSEAGPTATLWALSVAFFLEASRKGKPWAWIGAGLAGGFSIYFYPTGRLWPALAAVLCVYFLVHGLGRRRLEIARGVALSAVAAILIMTPFVANGLNHPETFTLRAAETSIFTQGNATRLRYYNPEWSTPQLLVEQTVRTVGAFNQFEDQGGFWPTDKPIMYGALALLTLLGLGWVCLKVRDPRYATLAAWFFFGILGVIVTVETPNYQRMAVAAPAMAFFPALVLDNLAHRVEFFVAGIKKANMKWATYARTGATALAAAVVVWICVDQGRFYFVDYAKVDRWPQPTIQGAAVRAQGEDTLVATLSRSYHMVNSGWVRLLAPTTPRGGMRTPNVDLPLGEPANTNLSFAVYPPAKFYLPYLRDIYPLGVTQVFSHPTEGVIVTMYKIRQSDWAAMQGAMAHLPSGQSVNVPTLGTVPSGIAAYPAQVSWTAGLRVPAYWNYSFRVGPGPARLTIDGAEVLNIPAATPEITATISLAAGDHAISYRGTIAAADQPAMFEWAQAPLLNNDGTSHPLQWQSPTTEQLISTQIEPDGLYGVLQQQDLMEQHIFSHTLAQCCLTEQVQDSGKPYTVNWTGNLDAPATGAYTMTLLAEGKTMLQIDGNTIISTDHASGDPSAVSLSLTAGKHAVAITFAVENTRGDIEWRWTPPGGEDSIVPPSALSPPANVGIGAPLDLTLYKGQRIRLEHTPLETVR